MKPNKKEIIEVSDRVKEAMLSFIELDENEKNIKLLKAKVHKELSLARDELRSLTFN